MNLSGWSSAEAVVSITINTITKPAMHMNEWNLIMVYSSLYKRIGNSENRTKPAQYVAWNNSPFDISILS